VAQTLGQVAMRSAEIQGKQKAEELGNKEGRSLSWEPKPALTAFGAWYNQAAQAAHEHEITTTLVNMRNEAFKRFENSPTPEADFDKYWGGVSSKFLGEISPSRRETVAKQVNSVADSLRSDLRISGAERAEAEIRAQYGSRLLSLGADAQFLGRDGKDWVATGHYEEMEGILRENTEAGGQLWTPEQAQAEREVMAKDFIRARADGAFLSAQTAGGDAAFLRRFMENPNHTMSKVLGRQLLNEEKIDADEAKAMVAGWESDAQAALSKMRSEDAATRRALQDQSDIAYVDFLEAIKRGEDPDDALKMYGHRMTTKDIRAAKTVAFDFEDPKGQAEALHAIEESRWKSRIDKGEVTVEEIMTAPVSAAARVELYEHHRKVQAGNVQTPADYGRSLIDGEMDALRNPKTGALVPGGAVRQQLAYEEIDAFIEEQQALGVRPEDLRTKVRDFVLDPENGLLFRATKIYNPKKGYAATDGMQPVLLPLWTTDAPFARWVDNDRDGWRVNWAGVTEEVERMFRAGDIDSDETLNRLRQIERLSRAAPTYRQGN